MDSFFAEPFMRKFPDNVRKGLSDPEDQYLILYERIRSGTMPVVTMRQSFVNFMEGLKERDVDMHKCMTSLVDAKKLFMLDNPSEISEALSKLTVGKTVLKEITPASNNSVKTIFYDEFENDRWKDWLISALNKPLFLEREIRDGKVEFLFKNLFFNLKPGETFDFENFFSKFQLPFRNIRILDPYLFANIEKVPLARILNSLAKKSQLVDIEIISSLEPDKNADSVKIKKKVLNQFSGYNFKGKNITLRSQRRSGKDVFHRRIIWTDFWCLKSDQSLNFLDKDFDFKRVKMENDLNLSGKYSSKESIWQKINDDWEVYQYYSEIFQNLTYD